MTDAAEQQQGEPLSLPKDQLQQQQEKHDSGVLAVDDSNVAKDDEGVSQTAAASEDDTLAKQQRDGGAAATATAPAPALHRPLTETSPLAMPARLDDRVSPEGTHESTLQLPSALPQQQQQSETPSKQQRVSPTNASLSPQRASPSNNEPVRRSPLGQTVVTHEDLGAGGEAVVEGRKRTRSAGANDENVDAAAPPPLGAITRKADAVQRDKLQAFSAEDMMHQRQRSRSLGAVSVHVKDRGTAAGELSNGSEADVKKAGGKLLGKLTKRKSEKEDVEMQMIGNRVDEHHRNYVLMYDMLSGIRVTISRCQAKPERPLTEQDYKSSHKLAFDMYDFKFKDYAPWVFRAIRKQFQIDPADYLMSLTGKYILSELGSPGKSGSFFYYSSDYRFIIKTISSVEHDVFLQMLPKYYKHICDNPNTLLARYCGLHRVKLPHGTKLHFVVMGNVFPPNRKIHETYDLKGSLVGRESLPKKDGTMPSILKDLNFLNNKQKLKLGPEKSALFVQQIKKDSDFLASCNIMDYSLLLGIHKLNQHEELPSDLYVVDPQLISPAPSYNPDPTKKERKQMKHLIKHTAPQAIDESNSTLPANLHPEQTISVFSQDDGGFQSTDADNRPLDEIYYMAIIDILTPYNFKKSLEHLFRSINNDAELISAVSPDKYGSRFAKFLEHGVDVLTEAGSGSGKKRARLTRTLTQDSVASASNSSGDVHGGGPSSAPPTGTPIAV